MSNRAREKVLDEVKSCPFCVHLPEVLEEDEGVFMIQCKNALCIMYDLDPVSLASWQAQRD